MIFDTNVLIYLSKSELNLEYILNEKAAISVITKIESLGYPFKSQNERDFLLDICKALPVLPLSDAIAEETISIRSKHKIKLPDAIIYATAVVSGLPLLTNNTDDFDKLGGRVKLIDPFKL